MTFFETLFTPISSTYSPFPMNNTSSLTDGSDWPRRNVFTLGIQLLRIYGHYTREQSIDRNTTIHRPHEFIENLKVVLFPRLLLRMPFNASCVI